ncbi:hypothetical protein GF377_07675 [candidate division GN15 bacterium]|nr:hypothetical protein [candidate division GN15 bacterium]
MSRGYPAGGIPVTPTTIPPPRVACVLLPNFAIEVCLKAAPHLADLPVVLVDEDIEAAEIIARNGIAADRGVLLTMTVAQARIVCDNLRPVLRDQDLEIEQSNRVYKILQRLSPFVEESSPGLYYLDAAGMTLLYQNDRQFADCIITDTRPVGYPVQVGIANNKYVARIAAERSAVNAATVVAINREARFLKPLPINQAHLPDDTVAMLRDLGLYTLGQVASFPANELRHRFGPDGFALAKLARGDDTAFFEPDRPTEDLTDSIWLTAPIYQADMIIARVEQLLAPLLTRLGRFSQGCATIVVTLTLDNRSEQAITITVDQPTLNTTTFVRQFKQQTADLNLTSPVTGITVTIPEVLRLAAEQLSLEGSDVSEAIDSDLPKQHAVTIPLPQDMLLPEQRFTLVPFVGNARKQHSANTPHTLYVTLGRINGLRLVQPPREITVITDNLHRPTGVQRYRATAIGPWELSGGWWSRYFDRVYWEVQTDHQRKYLVFYDRLLAKWYVQGVFD